MSLTREIFDHIVVGGGTSGLVVAARLVEDPTITVCVVEAGEDVSGRVSIQVPGMGYENMGNPKLDWNFESEPQADAGGRSFMLHRGKTLGGTSMLNLMVLGRGHATEYDAIETLGSPGWNWRELVEYFRKSETFSPTPAQISDFSLDINATTHGTTGPIQRTLSTWIGAIDAPFVDAMKALGVPYNPDSFSGNNVGMCKGSRSIDPQSTRSSSVSGYYEPVKSKLNLCVITGAHATRILFNDSVEVSGDIVASGVEYRKNGTLHSVSARKEVLLCAGSFQTPQLLELSGIGGKNILAAHEIPLLVELPGVGNNLQDHFWLPYIAETDSKYESIEVLRNPDRATEEWNLYQESKQGIFSGTTSPTFAFLPKQYFAKDWDHNQAVASLPPSPQNALQKEWLDEDTIPFLEIGIFPGFLPVTGHQPEDGKSYCSFLLALTHSFARGTVHITSNDPNVPPAINPRLLDNAPDVELLIQALKFARRLAQTGDLDAAITREILPGSEAQSDTDLEKYVRGTVSTVYHPIGTAAMLPRDAGGVVDATLRVYGTANLRVIDASIIPIHLSAHIQATVYAIAEKAVDIIKQGY
ncbi:alcohol oxidase [Mycena crocata]|nr:alcohol oxidase [Mycena crocata]